MAARKNSLVNNINRRKKKGTSRSKSRSTISGEAYDQMSRGWPKQRAKKKKKKAKKKSPKAKTPKKAVKKARPSKR
jgi:hypothetical protein